MGTGVSPVDVLSFDLNFAVSSLLGLFLFGLVLKGKGVPMMAVLFMFIHKTSAFFLTTKSEKKKTKHS